MSLVHATIEPGARLDLPWDVDFNALVYVLNGSGHGRHRGSPDPARASPPCSAPATTSPSPPTGSQESRSPQAGRDRRRRPADPRAARLGRPVRDEHQVRGARRPTRTSSAATSGTSPPEARSRHRVARIYRDAYGVPHVRATVVLDLARGPGLGHRAGPLVAAGVPPPPGHRHRRRGARRPRCVDWDVLRPAHPDRRDRAARVRRPRRGDAGLRHGVRRRASTTGCTPTRPSSIELGHRARSRGSPWTPLAVFHAQHLLFAALPDKLWQHRARDVLGEDAAVPAPRRRRARPAATPGPSAARAPRRACR